MKSALKKLGLGFLGLIAIFAALVAIEFFGGKPMGLFAGSRPTDLGYNNGQFKPPSWKPNCVSSTVDKTDQKHYIEPVRFSGEADAAWKKWVAVVKAQKQASVVSEKPNYLYAEFSTPGLGFVDDVEFALDAKMNVIHVRSASRLGIRDFDANRKRIEALRAAFLG